MALDKAQTNAIAKGVIIIFGIVLIVGLAGPSVAALLGSIFNGQDGSSSAGSGATALDAINAKYEPTIRSWETLLASDPASATLLVQLGNTYFDWALEIQQSTQVAPGSDTQYWRTAAQYYAQAISAGENDPGVRVDAAISNYYAGDVNAAVSLAEGVMKSDPGFPPAWFNGGIFYESTGRTGEALYAFKKYLELDSQGSFGNPQYAQDKVAELEGQGIAPAKPAFDGSAETSPQAQ